MTQRKLSPVARAYQRSEEVRKALRSLDSRPMELTEDKSGIVWERWTVSVGPMGADFISVILVATPDWWDLYHPISKSRYTAEVISALKALVK